jgi:hypothetical protein
MFGEVVAEKHSKSAEICSCTHPRSLRNSDKIKEENPIPRLIIAKSSKANAKRKLW